MDSSRASFLVLVACMIAALGGLGAAVSAADAQSHYEFAPSSDDGIGKYYFHREIARVMGFSGAAWLDRPERAQEERTDLLIRALNIEPGMGIADIGAGSGYLSRRMAPLAAPGVLYAVDVQPAMVDLLRKLAGEPGLANIKAIQGSARSVELPPAAVDLALMVDVYHELAYPYEIVSSVLKSLKPRGRLVLVEYRAEDPAVPINPVHKMSVAQILLEMRQFPLEVEKDDESLPLQHVLLFRKRM